MFVWCFSPVLHSGLALSHGLLLSWWSLAPSPQAALSISSAKFAMCCFYLQPTLCQPPFLSLPVCSGPMGSLKHHCSVCLKASKASKVRNNWFNLHITAVNRDLLSPCLLPLGQTALWNELLVYASAWLIRMYTCHGLIRSLYNHQLLLSNAQPVNRCEASRPSPFFLLSYLSNPFSHPFILASESELQQINRAGIHRKPAHSETLWPHPPKDSPFCWMVSYIVVKFSIAQCFHTEQPKQHEW